MNLTCLKMSPMLLMKIVHINKVPEMEHIDACVCPGADNPGMEDAQS